jgi:hypothetical protein
MSSRPREINLLFDETITHFRKLGKERFREYQIFEVVLGDTPEKHDAFFRFLHNVSTCPQEVIRWCQEQINPKRD